MVYDNHNNENKLSLLVLSVHLLFRQQSVLPVFNLPNLQLSQHAWYSARSFFSAFSLCWPPQFLVSFPPPFIQYGHTILELCFLGFSPLKKLHAILAIPQSVFHHLKMPYSTIPAVCNLESFHSVATFYLHITTSSVMLWNTLFLLSFNCC